MKLMTRWAAGGAAALALAGLAGCGGSAAAGGSSSSAASSGSSAKSTPSAKTLFPNGLTILVGYGPGGANDIAARLAQPYLQKALGVTVTVQNDAGAAGNLAAAKLYQEPANAAVIMPAFLPTLPLEQLLNNGHFKAESFTAVYGLYGNNDEVIYAKKGSPYNSLKSLQNAKGTITAAVSGLYNAAWFALAELEINNHVKIQVVPFTSGAQSDDAVLGGSVDITSGSSSSAIKAMKTGKAQTVVQFGPAPNSLFPNLQTIAQAGGSSSEAYQNEIGFYGPPKMSAAAIQVLDAAFAKVAQNPAFIQKAKASGLDTESVAHATFQQHLDQSFQQINTLLPQLQKLKATKKG